MATPQKAVIIDEDYEKLSNRQIVDYYLNDGLFRKCLEMQFLKMPAGDYWKKQYKEDMWQDLIVFLLTYDNDKLNNAHHFKHMNALITRILQNQLYSDHSKFYLDYCRLIRRSDELQDKHLIDDN